MFNIGDRVKIKSNGKTGKILQYTGLRWEVAHDNGGPSWTYDEINLELLNNFKLGDLVKIKRGVYSGMIGNILRESMGMYDIDLGFGIGNIVGFIDADLELLTTQQPMQPNSPKFKTGDKVQTSPGYNMSFGYKEGTIISKCPTFLNNWIIEVTLANGNYTKNSISESDLELVPRPPVPQYSLGSSIKSMPPGQIIYTNVMGGGGSGGTWVPPIPLSGVSAISNLTNKCIPNYKEYFGLNWKYNYCTKCNKKESEHE